MSETGQTSWYKIGTKVSSGKVVDAYDSPS
jgi:hypothetical protein